MDSPDTSAAGRPLYPRLCVLTGFGPSGSFGGGVILRSILEGYPAERLLWISLYGECPVQTRPSMPPARRPSVLLALLRPAVRLRRTLLTVRESRRTANAVLQQIRAFSPQVCWMVLDFNTVLTFRHVMRRTSVPVHVSVHDDPVIATTLCYYPLPLWLVQSAFVYCYTHAASRDCVSSRMISAYEKRLGAKAFVVTRGVRTLPRPTGHSLDSGINVVLGGLASNCKPPWPRNVFGALAALREATGRRVEFHCFDPAVSPDEPFVKVHPLLPEREFDAFIGAMHIGYACDPLTPVGRRFAASSLPTKIITYIGFGLPFVYHGPRDSTVGDLLAKHHAGVIVESEDKDDVFRAFLEVVENYKVMQKACCAAAASEFDSSIIQGRVLSALRKIALKEQF